MNGYIAISVLLLFGVAVFGLRRLRAAWWKRMVAGVLEPRPLTELFKKIDATPDHPESFGYKMQWLAVRSSDAESVLAALPMANTQPANWHTGVTAAYNGHVFVTPPVEGWVFVLWEGLPELGHGPSADEWESLMSSLSRTHADVQYFGTHRVVGFVAWARFVDGSETRAFAYSGERGEVMADRGARTSGEIELGYQYFDSNCAEAESEAYWEREDLCYPDEEHVMEVAGKWSINPQFLEEMPLPKSAGWIGNLPRAPRKKS